jgi:hypothetical protein
MCTQCLGVQLDHPDLPGWGLGAGLTIQPCKKFIVTKPHKVRPGSELGYRAIWWWWWFSISPPMSAFPKWFFSLRVFRPKFCRHFSSLMRTTAPPPQFRYTWFKCYFLKACNLLSLPATSFRYQNRKYVINDMLPNMLIMETSAVRHGHSRTYRILESWVRISLEVCMC